MSFGGDADEGESARLYRRARESGINFFDCANVYAKGESERILGKLIANERDDVFIASKAFFPIGEGSNERGSSRLHLRASVEASLKGLGTDRLDLFFLHAFDVDTDLERTLRALDDLVRAGKILYLGASNFAAWQIMKALGIQRAGGLESFCAIQPMYNLVKRTAEIELFPMARSEELAVIPYSPLGGGLLTGKYVQSDAKGRIAENSMYRQRYASRDAHESARRFAELAAEAGVHPATLAVAWVRRNKAVTAPLLGARNVQQLEPGLAAATFDLDDELAQRIEAMVPAPPPATDRTEERSGQSYGAQLLATQR